MKIITLWQPWASAIALGFKRIETRSWSTDYRGRVAIHAALAWHSAEALEMLSHPELRLCFKGGNQAPEIVAREMRLTLPFGSIVAVGDLVDCLPTESDLCRHGVFEHYPEMNDETERLFGNYGPGRFALVLENIRPTSTPIPFKSRQGKLIDAPEEIRRIIA